MGSFVFYCSRYFLPQNSCIFLRALKFKRFSSKQYKRSSSCFYFLRLLIFELTKLFSIFFSVFLYCAHEKLNQKVTKMIIQINLSSRNFVLILLSFCLNLLKSQFWQFTFSWHTESSRLFNQFFVIINFSQKTYFWFRCSQHVISVR